MVSSCRLFASLPPAEALQDRNLSDLKRTWDEEYADTGDDWARVQMALASTAPEIGTVLINGKSSDALDYESYEGGRKVIAVGGLALSRGLTLEGLTISYYLRRSVMYDTLMQMGRWFGYRLGYEHLCRVFMTEESAGHYEHVAESVVELQRELKQMQQAGANPTQFGLKVRSHPDMLMVTAKNKMGAAEEKVWNVELAAKLIETHHLDRREHSLDANRRLAISLAQQLLTGHSFERPPGTDHYLFTDIPARLVTDFLEGYRNSPSSMLSDPLFILDYITPRIHDELAKWDILFVSVAKARGQADTTETIGEMAVGCQSRRIDNGRSDSQTIASRKDRVASRGAEKFGLAPYVIAEVDSDFKKTNPGQSVPDVNYRKRRSRPLLIVHFIDYRTEEDARLLDKPAVAWSLSFPDSQHLEKTVKYVINAVAAAEQRRLYETETYDDDADEDDYDG